MVSTMSTWSRVALTAFLLGACIPLASAGATIGLQAYLAAQGPPGGCESKPLDAFLFESTPFDGSVVMRITNEGEAATARVCLFNAWGEKKLDIMVPMAAGETRDVVVEAPRGVYTFRAEAQMDEFSTWGQGTLSTVWCVSGSADVHQSFHVGPTGSGGTAWGGGCVPGALAVGLVGLVASGGAFAAANPHVGSFLLYSRLARPRLLDHDVRARVHALVAREPGIHSREIGRALDVGDGQVAYHLGVLARERILVSVGMPGFRHWFLAGQHSPREMSALVSLRDATRRRLYDAIVTAPGASLSDVAVQAGVSMTQASRATKALERAGLVVRTKDGRALGLRPTPLTEGG